MSHQDRDPSSEHRHAQITNHEADKRYGFCERSAIALSVPGQRKMAADYRRDGREPEGEQSENAEGNGPDGKRG